MARNPTPGGRRSEADRNDHIVLTAARDVFIEQGWDAPISAVSKRSGLGMGSIYRRYASKDELFAAMFAACMDEAADEALTALAEEPDGWSALRRLMRAMLHSGVGSLFAQVAEHEQARAAFRDSGGSLRAAIDRIVADARRDGALRREVTSADICLALRHVKPPHGPDVKRERQLQLRYLEVLLDGLAEPGSGTADRASRELPGPGPQWDDLASGKA
ncbi:TetR/AcrR family transcriptional regulator; helix-turn-helix transcriptional regulator [Yinghuangia sp. ASG 101]|uniref:TetR/AcrR family transcriptional regulator n=1 Tax=Yinghuangia sp. ASG 101 TaxID=2896848 RepID=UPI001E30B333|nr:TetR/AcrR family transcriptional regulator [Yinghuangia sp. ASG 101]UGQ11782.1 TetR/AcrR family transcriptional regulator; helix-turn-helix transcriptional regulator [Yinghuangia sp. ASG 101]